MYRRGTEGLTDFKPDKETPQDQATHLLEAIIEEQQELGELGIELEYLLRIGGVKLQNEPVGSHALH